MDRLFVAFGTLCSDCYAIIKASKTIFLFFLFSIGIFSSCRKDPKMLPTEVAANSSNETSVLNITTPVDFVTLYDGSKNTKNLPIPPFFANTSLTVPTGLISDTLFPIAGCTDYAPIIFQKLHAIALTPGGGTLYIKSGGYPVLSSINIVLYDTYNSSISPISIVGEPTQVGNSIRYPILYDSASALTPHSFLNFVGTPDDDVKEIYVNGLEIVGNNVAANGLNHPFIGIGDIYAPAISLGNVNKAALYNVYIRNQYGDAIRVANWSPSPMDDYNIGLGVEVNTCHFIDCWSDNGRNDSGDGVMFWHVNNPSVKNTVVSNAFSKTHYYGRMGIVLEAGTKNAIINNCFVQGYREGIRCELDFGGHKITRNLIGKNRIAGMAFAQDIIQYNNIPTSSFSGNLVADNVFVYGQYFQEFGATHSTFISMANHEYALSGMQIINNSFHFYEENSSPDRAEHLAVSHPYSIYIQTHGQQELTISGNQFN